MKRICLALLSAALIVPAAGAATVTVGDSTAGWLGFMNVTELDSSPAFANGWGVADLVATFDDGAGELTLTPNTIGDPNEYWYQNTTGMAADPVNPGGPGQAGNKIMDANLFIQVDDDSLAGTTVTFEGEILSNSLTDDHETIIFIRDFAPDFSSFTESTALATPGAFSIDLATDPGLGRHVQYGFATKGVNVWVTDVAPFGSVVIAAGNAIPEPTSAVLIGLGAFGTLAARRRR